MSKAGVWLATGARVFCAIAAVGAAVFQAGCGTPQRFDAMPSALAAEPTFLRIPNARFDGDNARALQAEMRQSMQRAQKGEARAPAFLALSGGQEDGAFGAGLLAGWSDHGDRPQFKIVTGTSTGALAAPFAFLGSDFDWALEKMYTMTGADEVISKRFLTAAINDDAMMDSEPLERTIAAYLDARVLQKIGEEYEQGRLLFISTTNLDAGKQVIWNIGAIAASKHPRNLALVRKIVLASAAVPGLFPPVMIDIKLDNARYQEMHVDGGAVSQVFLYPPGLALGTILPISTTTRPVAYIIRNRRAALDPQNVDRTTLAIAGRAIETMITSNGIGDLYRIYTTTQRDGVTFNLALIGEDFKEPYTRAFDKGYMRKLFDYGRTKGRHGYPWRNVPPGFSR